MKLHAIPSHRERILVHSFFLGLLFQPNIEHLNVHLMCKQEISAGW
jgi:hypothetical protein